MAGTDASSGPVRVDALELDMAACPYADLSDILGYWSAKCDGRFAPRRADIDPIDLVAWLPRIMLADVLADPLDFRYRLSGTGICDMHGQEPTGQSPRDLTPPPFGALIHAHYCAAVARRAPILHLIVLDASDRSRSYARLILPLSEDGAAVTMLMTVDSKEQNTRALKNFFAQMSGR
ncbi:MAG TPA: PAS domain-containing protein [Stellaceae bacterium]|nr:PAS domain-containing protein [Stellaceae bacterium]